LITGFSAACDKATGWIKVTPDAAGVTELNHLLRDILTELQGGAVANDTFTYSIVNGVSTPLDTNTDFEYQLRLTISIVGSVKVKTLK